jgi:hypothetical protein
MEGHARGMPQKLQRPSISLKLAYPPQPTDRPMDEHFMHHCLNPHLTNTTYEDGKAQRPGGHRTCSQG